MKSQERNSNYNEHYSFIDEYTIYMAEDNELAATKVQSLYLKVTNFVGI